MQKTVLPDRALSIGQKLAENAKSQMRHFDYFSNNVLPFFRSLSLERLAIFSLLENDTMRKRAAGLPELQHGNKKVQLRGRREHHHQLLLSFSPKIVETR